MATTPLVDSEAGLSSRCDLLLASPAVVIVVVGAVFDVGFGKGSELAPHSPYPGKRHRVDTEGRRQRERRASNDMAAVDCKSIKSRSDFK